MQLRSEQAAGLLVQTLRGHAKDVETVVFAHRSYDLVTASETEGNACLWRCSADFAVCEKTVLHGDISGSARGNRA